MAGRVALILLNFNGWADTVTCLESVYRSELLPAWVVVCDNGSSDDSLARIQAWAEGRLSPLYDRGPSRQWAWPPVEKPIPWVAAGAAADHPPGARPELILLAHGANLGFATGNNIGIRWALEAGCDSIWLLNNDTVVAPDTLPRLVAAAERDPQAAALSSVLLEYYRPERVQMTGGRILPSLGTSRKMGQTMTAAQAFAAPVMELDFVSGCSLLLPRAALETVGLLEEAYFLYWEDGDWCLRARRRGYRVICVPQSAVWHREGASWGLRSRRQYAFDMESALVFLRRHYPLRLPLALALKPALNVYSAVKHGASPLAAVAGSCSGIWRYLRRRQSRTAVAT